MPELRTLQNLFGGNFKDFGTILPGLEMVYALSSQDFPIGYIGDLSTPADSARLVIDRTLGTEFGPIRHIALGHEKHGQIVVATDVADELEKQDGLFPSMTDNCDGIIVKRRDAPLVISTFLGDCAAVIVSSKNHVGYMHVGRPEVMAEPKGVIENFFEKWTDEPHETRVWVGPCIKGWHYELPEIPTRFIRYTTRTFWETQGFNLHIAIIDQISQHGLIEGCDIRNVDIDPFAVNMKGDHSWAASDQYYRREGRNLNHPQFSPRNAALLFIGS